MFREGIKEVERTVSVWFEEEQTFENNGIKGQVTSEQFAGLAMLVWLCPGPDQCRLSYLFIKLHF